MCKKTKQKTKQQTTTKLSNHVTSLRSSSGKIAVHSLDFSTNSKLPGFIQLIKNKNSLVPPKKETKNVHNYNKNLSWKIFFFFFWSASFKADFLTLFPISDFRTIKFSVKMVKGAIHRNRFVKRINCIKVSEPFNPQFNVFFVVVFFFLNRFSV